MSVEEVEAQPDAVIGKFLVKSFTATVLFDTGASHSYISRGFVNKFKLSVHPSSQNPYVSNLARSRVYGHPRMFSDTTGHW